MLDLYRPPTRLSVKAIDVINGRRVSTVISADSITAPVYTVVAPFIEPAAARVPTIPGRQPLASVFIPFIELAAARVPTIPGRQPLASVVTPFIEPAAAGVPTIPGWQPLVSLDDTG